MGRVCPRHGHRGRPLNSVVRRHWGTIVTSAVVQLRLYEFLLLVAWFCGPAVVLAIGGETWFFLKHRLFRERRAYVITSYLLTIVLVPMLSVGLLVAGVGQSPLENRGIGFAPWFWQSFIAAAIVGGAVIEWRRRKLGRQ